MSTCILDGRIPRFLEKPPKLQDYNGDEDPKEHVEHVDDRLNYYHSDGDIKCKLFVLTMIESSRDWYKTFPMEP